MLRNDLGLSGAKYGCGRGQCGACNVLIDGQPGRAGVIPAKALAGCEILTLEGLGGPGRWHPVQQAFIDAQAAPSHGRIADALAGNLCRCGAHVEILRALRLAAQAMQASPGR